MTTTDLVPVFAGTLAGIPVQLCNARDLHAALGVGRDFTTWIKERIDEYAFVEGEDYSPVLGNIRGRGKPRTDYHLSIDMAKELSMVENNDLGRRIRRYLIALEKKALSASTQPRLSEPVPTFANRRWLHVVAADGRETARLIGNDDFLTNLREFPEMLRDTGFLVTSDELAEIIRACTDRMAAKLRGRANAIMKG